MRSFELDPLNQIRLANLDILMGDMTQGAFARRVGMSQSAINHFKSGRTTMGRTSCARIETALGLSDGAMDKDGGVSPLTAEQRKIASGGPYRPSVTAVPDSFGFRVEVSNPMHYAVIDAFVKLVQSGLLSYERCSQMISQFTLMRSGGGRTRSEETDALLARLAVNEFKVVYSGEGGREEATVRLENEFGPVVAASFGRHFVDIQSLSAAVGAEVAQRLAK